MSESSDPSNPSTSGASNGKSGKPGKSSGGGSGKSRKFGGGKYGKSGGGGSGRGTSGFGCTGESSARSVSLGLGKIPVSAMNSFCLPAPTICENPAPTPSHTGCKEDCK